MERGDIEKMFLSIKGVTDMKVSQGDIVAAQEKLLRLSDISGTAAELVAICEYEVLKHQGEVIGKYIDKKLSPTVLEMVVKGELPYEFSSLTHAKNIINIITSSQDALRTVISLYKSELEQSR